MISKRVGIVITTVCVMLAPFWGIWFFLGHWLQIYIFTVLLAGMVSWLLHFSKYILGGVVGVKSAFLGCLLLWPVFFPWFVFNALKVATGSAELRTEAVDHSGDLSEFYAFLGSGACRTITFLVAWPTAVPAPQRFNEAQAVSRLKEYAAAQQLYRQDRITAGETPVFCEKLRNLYYGEDENGQPPALAKKEFADAYASSDVNATLENRLRFASRADNGYWFAEDPYVTQNMLWSKTFALIAYPAIPGKTGNDVFWIGDDGIVKILHESPVGRPPRLTKAEQSPLAKNSTFKWIDL